MPSEQTKQKTNTGRDRVTILIDGSNLYHSLEENCGRYDLDFGAFARKLCDGRSLFRIYYYNVLRDADRNPQAFQDQQKFLSALYNTPYLEVRLGVSKMRGENRTPILVFGDYDADGITEAAMLTLVLSSIGVERTPYIPDREQEG